ncbi:MAG TPA: hypothetical protein GXX46_13180 [Peptococcaceae bacterium]|nr:hypothetical protein [Peptococcaceae bacterium]
MKQKIIYLFVLIICLCFLPNIAFAASPSATLTADGMPIGTYASVQEAVNAITLITAENFVIEIAEGTVTDPLDILQLPNKNVVIRPQSGASVVFTNTITIDGNGNLSSPESLLIQGLSFDFTSGTSANCIYFNLLPTRTGHCYPHNVTINGCSFKGILDGTVAVQSVTGGSRNISIINCSATDMHSLAQLKAVSGYAFVQNCTLSNSSEGVNFYGVGDLVIDSCKFDAVGYAVRSGQSVAIVISPGSVIINNSILNSNSMGDGTIVLRGDSAGNISILHSNITNENSDGAVIQNLNLDREEEYLIGIVESNLTGVITGIDLSTITTIDDPNVENGPVCIKNGSDHDLIFLITILIIIIIILLIVICAFIVCICYPCRKRHNSCS